MILVDIIKVKIVCHLISQVMPLRYHVHIMHPRGTPAAPPRHPRGTPVNAASSLLSESRSLPTAHAMLVSERAVTPPASRSKLLAVIVQSDCSTDDEECNAFICI